MRAPVKPSYVRALIIFACGLVLAQIIAQTNHYLAPTRVYLWIGGLYVTFAALHLTYRVGLAAILLIGLALDAGSGARFGLHALIFGIGHAVLHPLRNRVAGEETIVAVLIALLMNLALFILFSAIQLDATPDPAIAGLRVLVDLMASQCALALIAPWFFALQSKALYYARLGLRDEPSGLM
jgi:cell shape-determining protein MreD